ncbi:hypothetical protein C3747_4g690 [Trypanosoma cruzi]|uniref:Uncharacterized protein n=2 Tax=Trypanosoma cruzi TaxID=5693 RepID=Q4D920_TRYCC|nr:hypothetical protein, conserved [Trypanosoma cruzi]EAN89016.1 hypothetical protein, conserved [Trypanosoma cruzi]PWV20912.1 hypothetical protein C3747_4g690 [Trypanosoma cruzi]RNC49283.1 hypothetical protein TcCL_NonESM00830 [Trypanosoma cruzi]|eukprot:XP_810867.1 hypothetical protein [Trypanosoma cruzi strain CL Brener]
MPSSERWRPFLSPHLKEYMDRYWAVMFTVGSRPIETGHLRHYVSWYCTRMKVVQLDHHIYAESLHRQLLEVAQTPELPLLFVNKKLVGTLRDVQELESAKKLKDVLHFGFEWRVGGGGVGERPLQGFLPSPYGDTEMFRGRYRGAPVARPVVALPKLHPLDRRSEE